MSAPEPQVPPRGEKARPTKPPGDEGRQRWITIAWLIGAVILFALLQFRPLTNGGPKEITFSRFLTLVDDGQVTEASIATDSVQGTYTEDDNDVSFVATLPP